MTVPGRLGVRLLRSESNESLAAAYRGEAEKTQVVRIPFAYMAMAMAAVASSLLEYFIRPERMHAVLLVTIPFLVTCLATIGLVRRRPNWSFTATLVSNNALAVLVAAYSAMVGGVAEMCVASLVLLMTIFCFLNTWGLTYQALTSVGAVVAYPLTLAAGAHAVVPVPFGLATLVTAAALTLVFAYLLNGERYEAFRLREASRNSEERYRTLHDNNPAMYFTVDADGTVLSVNLFGAAQLGYTVDELLGAPVLQVFVPEDRAPVLSQLHACVQHPGQIVSWEFRKVRKDGSVLWVKEVARALQDTEGHTVVFIVCEDITDRRRAEQQARQHQAELAHVARLSTMGEMAAALAHELNQPLAAIVNYTRGCERRIQAGTAQPEDLLQPLREVSEQALRAGEIIRRIRRFVRKAAPKEERVNLNDLVQEVARLAEPEGEQRGIHLRLDLGSSLPLVRVDTIQIEQVILNLVRNGFEAMEGNGTGAREVAIRTSAPESNVVELGVCDSGEGLPRDMVDKAFEPFFSTKTNGLGMGLGISRSIIEAHGGRLWATPNAQGGMTFRFTLPVRSTPELMAGSGPVSAPQPG